MSVQATLFITDGNAIRQEHEVRFKSDPNAEMELVKLYPDHLKQTIIGFGAAITDAAASTYSQMSEHQQRQLMQDCFSADGNAYSLCRTTIMSCDFSRKPYSYVAKGDKSLETFSVDADDEVLVPMIRDAMAVNDSIEWLASPWSPPAFMKTNGLRKLGGHLRKQYYDKWADMIVRYVQEYAKRGITIRRLTMQNEPNAVQTWESCVMSADEERIFAKDYVKPALHEVGLDDVKIMIWDHNKDQILDRIQQEFADSEFEDIVDGVGFHWYSGDHFESLAEAARLYPDKEFIMTEGCVEYSAEWKSDMQKAEKYAHDIIGDLEAGAHGYIDWNILLNEAGGPNHVKNYCDAPLMYDRETKQLRRNISFNYIGQFSHFIKPGARRMLCSRWTSDLEAVAAVNPDGTHVLVVLNTRDWDQDCNVHENGGTCSFTVPSHSIATLSWLPQVGIDA